jgi:hypothetical protein
MFDPVADKSETLTLSQNDWTASPVGAATEVMFNVTAVLVKLAHPEVSFVAST